MPTRSSKKKPRHPDPSVLAFIIVQVVIGEPPSPPTVDNGKNPHAVALGCMGGLKRGKARAAVMTAKQRSAAAKKAARARWGKG